MDAIVEGPNYEFAAETHEVEVVVDPIAPHRTTTAPA